MANEEILKDEDMVEYDTFTYELNGKTMEWAITDEFEFEGKKYIVCAEVIGDTLSDEGLYLFESVSDEGDEITVRNIESEDEYNRVVDEYCNLSEEEAE
ncbi:MAG: DUF1292 domain-containing protein [Agathobacter sp.]|nr:DUF1292 domain-containing protein [Agathobacter sp.]